ncbi:MAG: hypothetical protein GXO89_16185 [Chlorobi bacterium]|nr:hypothetical protein [Chlorobiota bacterium]
MKKKAEISKTRNTLIASLLARTKYVEKMGTGIIRMNNAMKKAGFPALIFDYDEFTFFTIINDGSNSGAFQKTPVNKDDFNSSERIGENERKILVLIEKNNQMTY